MDYGTPTAQDNEAYDVYNDNLSQDKQDNNINLRNSMKLP